MKYVKCLLLVLTLSFVCLRLTEAASSGQQPPLRFYCGDDVKHDATVMIGNQFYTTTYGFITEIETFSSQEAAFEELKKRCGDAVRIGTPTGFYQMIVDHKWQLGH